MTKQFSGSMVEYYLSRVWSTRMPTSWKLRRRPSCLSYRMQLWTNVSIEVLNNILVTKCQSKLLGVIFELYQCFMCSKTETEKKSIIKMGKSKPIPIIILMKFS